MTSPSNCPSETAVRAVILSQRADKTLNGQVAEIELLDGNGKSVIRTRVPENVSGHQIELPAGTRMKSFTLRVHASTIDLSPRLRNWISLGNRPGHLQRIANVWSAAGIGAKRR